MKEYQDKNKKIKIEDLMQQRIPVSFKVLEQLEEDGKIEDYDLFRVLSEHFDNVFVFYLDGEFNVINRKRNNFREIDRDYLQDNYFLLNRCITNSIQGYIQRKGETAFNQLSTKEFIEAMLLNADSLLNKGEER